MIGMRTLRPSVRRLLLPLAAVSMLALTSCAVYPDNGYYGYNRGYYRHHYHRYGYNEGYYYPRYGYSYGYYGYAPSGGGG
jgi:hypothetical protein